VPSVLATAFVEIKAIGGALGKDIQKELESGAAGAEGAGGKAGKSWARGFQNSPITKAANMISLAMVGAGAASVVMAVKFDSAMTRLVTQAGVSKNQLAGLEKGVLNLAGQVGFSPDSLAVSLYHVESNFSSMGISSSKALGLVKIAAEGAAVGGANLEDVTNALTAAVASGIPGVKNFSQAMGSLNAIVGAGDMTMQDLSEAFGTGMVAVVKGYGLSLTDVGAALDVFGDNNIRGAKAGTELRMSVQALAVPAAAGAAELKKLGLSSTSLAKAMATGGLLPAMQLLIARMKAAGVSATQQGDVITTIFGKKAGTGVAILADQMQRLESKYPALTKGADNFGKAWATAAQTPAQKFKELEAGAEALGISVGQRLIPPVMAAVGWLDKNQAAAADLALTIGGLAIGITAVSLAIRAWTAISAVAGAVTGAAGAFRSLSGAAMAAAGAQKLLSVDTAALATTTGAFEVTLDGQVVATEAATLAAGELTIAERAAAISGALLAAVNPFVWVAGAVVVIGALGYALVKYGDRSADLVGQLTQQDKATGYNIAGYQRLSGQLATAAGSQATLMQQTRLSVSGMELAKEGAGGYAGELSSVQQAQQAAQVMAQNLGGRLGYLQTQFGLTRGQAEQAATAAGLTARQFAASGVQGLLALPKVNAWATGAGKAQVAAWEAANGTNAWNTAMSNMSNGLLAAQGDTISWKQSQQAATTALGYSTTGLKGNSAAALNAQSAMQQSTVAALQLANQQHNVQHNVKGASATLQAQITYLQQTGGGSQFAAQEIAALRTQLGLLKSQALAVTVTGKGTYSVISQGQVSGPSGGPHMVAAAGMLVRGGVPGKDSVPIMAMPGELVVPKSMVEGLRPVLGGKIPGFAAGGIVPTYSGAPGYSEGRWVAGNYNATAALLEAAVAKATAAGIQTAIASQYPAGAGGGNALANQALAKQLMPAWSAGAEWAAWLALWTRESGWNQLADNASSGAYGIPQALPASKMGPAANPPQSNPSAQERWGIGYIEGRYGDPIGAEAHESAFGWYGAGGPINEPIWGKGLMTGRNYRFGESGPEHVAPGAVPSSGTGNAEIAALLRQLIGVASGIGGDTATAMNSVAGRSLTRSLYPNRTGAGR
jgi:TP901 family phage tail tape measure protein